MHVMHRLPDSYREFPVYGIGHLPRDETPRNALGIRIDPGVRRIATTYSPTGPQPSMGTIDWTPHTRLLLGALGTCVRQPSPVAMGQTHNPSEARHLVEPSGQYGILH